MGSKVVALDSDERFLRDANRQVAEVSSQNEKLVNALYEAREQITALKEEVDKLCAPPSTYGVYLAGKKGERIVSAQTLRHEEPTPTRSVERVPATGQYL